MKVNFINFNGIEHYTRVMYNEVKDSDKYRIEVAYNGKDIKELLEYLFRLEEENKKQKEVLDNIIDELEKWVKENNLGKYRTENVVNTDELLDKLNELKEN